MKSRPLFSLLVLSTLALTVSVRTWADEEADLDKLPAAVQKTAHQEIGKSPVEEVEATFEDGQHATEVEYSENGKKMAVVIAHDGTLIQKEHRLSPGEAPAAIQKAIEAQFPGDRISHLKEVESKGKTFYEVSVKAAGKAHHLKLDAAGKPLS